VEWRQKRPAIQINRVPPEGAQSARLAAVVCPENRGRGDADLNTLPQALVQPHAIASGRGPQAHRMSEIPQSKSADLFLLRQKVIVGAEKPHNSASLFLRGHRAASAWQTSPRAGARRFVRIPLFAKLVKYASREPARVQCTRNAVLPAPPASLPGYYRKPLAPPELLVIVSITSGIFFAPSAQDPKSLSTSCSPDGAGGWAPSFRRVDPGAVAPTNSAVGARRVEVRVVRHDVALFAHHR